MVKKLSGILFVLFITVQGFAQQYPVFTHADSVRGKLSAARSCYDVYFYDLHLKINPEQHSIEGYNMIAFSVVKKFTEMQVDLFKNMTIDSIVWHNNFLNFRRDSNAIIISFSGGGRNEEKSFIKSGFYAIEHEGIKDSIKIYYHGFPQTAKNPPWDGGFEWNKDSLGKTWVDVSDEHTGASLWWPCKDHLSDKPDSMRMTFDVPTGLTCVSNGRLRSVKNLENMYTRFTWFVSNPIINYDVTLNIADYAHIADYYLSGKDTLTLDYYVLKYNVERARKHFRQVKTMLGCYEHFFGKYPFYKDGYKLVETSYWGMEHQSCVAYGNHYKNLTYGFDFIIIHESAHEWWGNSLSCSDAAEMWLHEAFATYAEALFIEYTQNYKTAVRYLHGQEKRIGNKYPVIGPYNVNFEGTANDDDEYFKGTWMLQTLRHVVNNDSLFFKIFKGLQEKFYHSNTNSNEVIAYINQVLGKDYTPFFNQYLRNPSPPVFQYTLKQKGKSTILKYHWLNVVKDFQMPLKVTSKVKDSINTYITITPTTEWKTIKLKHLNAAQFAIDIDEFYVIPRKEEVE